ncbi:MAG: tetratricopeptide repeat protein, partial [Candidatus Thiodiazotropha sp.]
PVNGPNRGKRLKRLIILAALFVAFPAVQLLSRLVFYGDPLPNTFYAKLSGELPGLHQQGLNYVFDFLLNGGAIVLLLPLLGLVLILERLSGKALAIVPLVALALALAETGLAYRSVNEAAFRQIKTAGDERELLSAWLERRFPGDSLLAINAAGLVPYRTDFPAVDMLGLSDRHIARAKVDSASGGTVFVGHYKHDGNYVCRRMPDLVVTSGARLFAGQSADEAIVQAASNTFPGDREFLQAAACQGRYHPVAEELLPGRFAVVYVRGEAAAEASTGESPATAEAWFRQGIALMQQARLAEAAQAFEASLRLRPDHPITQTNLGEALFGLALSLEKLNRREDTIAAWKRYLSQAKPGSPWTDRARQHLNLLGAGEQ